MAMGIPVICNDIGDTGKIIENSHSGIVLKNLDLNSYLNACEDLYSNHFTRDKIRRYAMKFYDLKKGAEKYLHVYYLLEK